MSNLRQRCDHHHVATFLDADILVRTYAVSHPPGLHLREQIMVRWHQLVHPSRGILHVVSNDQEWVVPPQRAVWVPAGTSHAVFVPGHASLRILYFAVDCDACKDPTEGSTCESWLADQPTAHAQNQRTRAIAVSPLLSELIVETCRRGVLRRKSPADRHLAGLTHELLEALPDESLHLPLPTDSRAARASTILRSGPGMLLSLDEIGALAGASKRTLERVYACETGLTLGRWRRRARIAFSLELLADGKPIGEVAADAGYASSSAFIVAFRAETRCTPGSYFA